MHAFAPPSEPRFTDVAPSAGLTDATKRVAWGDLDGDGWLDIVADTRRILVNRPDDGAGNGARRFVDVTAESGFAMPDGSAPLFTVLGDVDNDGDLDIFAGASSTPERWKPDPERRGEPLRDANGQPQLATPNPTARSQVFLNDGRGGFTAVERSGFEDICERAMCGAFVDYDLDGILDLFIGNGYRNYGFSLEAYHDRLFKGEGDGRFRDVTASAGLVTRRTPGWRDSARPTYGVVAGDVDGDGAPDLLTCAYGRQWNQLWRNRGDGTFEEIAATCSFDGDDFRAGLYPPTTRRSTELPFRSNGNTFDCALADFDEDGDLDAFLGEIAHGWAGRDSDRSTLLVNRGGWPLRFDRDRTRGIDRPLDGAPRWNEGDIHTGWIDANGDGRLDLVIASGDYAYQRLRVFAQGRDHRFVDATESLGIDWPSCGGLSIGDANGDHAPDILVGRSPMRLGRETLDRIGRRPALWLQPRRDDVRWIAVTLAGAGRGRTNRLGVGSWVTVTTPRGRQRREIRAGEGHAGHQNAAVAYFALPIVDGTPAISELRVEWANRERSVDRFTTIPEGGAVRVIESSSAGRPGRLEGTPPNG